MSFYEDFEENQPLNEEGNGLPVEQTTSSEENKTSKEDKKSTERLAKVLKSNLKKQSLIKALLPILIYVLIFIIMLIIIIGIVMFLITMPGMVMEKLKEIATDWADAIAATFGADTTRQVHNVDVVDTLNYLEDMGYDLKADGFLTEYVGSEKDGVIRNEDQSIKNATSEFVKTYLISENYMYTIKNYNMVTNGNIFQAIGQLLASAFTSGMANQYWSRGMIEIWKDTGTLGETNKFLYYNNSELGEDIEVDTENKTLKIKSTLGNDLMTYKLDGWTGRYGMPLEFLVSVHMATKMPDLSYEMATAFETIVHLYLHQIGNFIGSQGTSVTTTGWYELPSGRRVSYEQFNEATGNKKITKNNVVKVMKELVIESPDNCENYEEAISEREEQTDSSENNVEQAKCSNLDPEEDKGCSVCVDYVKNIFKAVEEVSTDEIGTKQYQPYIAKVTDHWYRDVYFTYNKSKDGELPFVDYDYDYEAKVKERWTLYETDENQEYKLYEMKQNENGEYVEVLYNGTQEQADAEGKMVTKKAKTVLVDNEHEDNRDDLKWNKITNDIVSAYTINGQTVSDLQQVQYEDEDDENAGNVYVNISSTGSIKQTGEGLRTETNAKIKRLFLNNYYFRYADSDTAEVITKFRHNLESVVPIQENLDDIFNQAIEDAKTNLDEWINNNIIEDELYIFVEVDENGNPKKDSEGHYIYHTEESTPDSGTFNIRYNGNAGINTNVEKLEYTRERVQNALNVYYENDDFEELSNTFNLLLMDSNCLFIGDMETRIRSFMRSVSEEVAVDEDTSDYFYFGPVKGTLYLYEGGKIVEKEVDYTKDANTGRNRTVSLDGNTYDITEYIANLSGIIDQEALNAFSMLENTHTLDADYIYRDFKELIVELGYFDKHDLTDETPRALQWLVPDTGSYQFPKRGIDKKEQDSRSTLIHSKGDIDAYTEYTVREMIDQMGSEIPEDINDQQRRDVNGSQGLVNGLNSRISNPEVGAIGEPSDGTKKVTEVSIDEFLETTREMCEYINQEGYDYCVLVTDAGNGEQRCHHSPVHGNPCSLPTTFAESQTSVTKHNFCCATLVSWALQNVGVMPDSAHLDGANNLADWILNNLDPEVISVGSELKPGDILCYDQHIDLVGEEHEGGFVKYNGGHYVDIGSVEFNGTSCIQHIDGWPNDSRIKFALRLNWGNTRGNGQEYTGYEGNEAVVSPVTGILLEYGTYDDNHINSITGEKERVNVDIKYGVQKVQYNDEEEQQNADPVSINVETSVDTGRIISEKVGYAKILVLDKEHYQKFEEEFLSSTTKDWASYLGSKWANTFLLENGKFLDLDDIKDDFRLNEDEIKDWSTADKTLYGYKEFAELYDDLGIAGNVITIDGFKCELPDENFDASSDNESKPSGEEIKEEDFQRITVDSFASEGELGANEEYARPSLYEADEEINMASQKATDKANTEITIKNDAATSLYVNGFTIIKEGTIIGRTLTDREVAEDYLNEEYEKYRKPRGTDESDKVMGNYLRIAMVQKEGTKQESTSIENVEDYMKLDDGTDNSKKTLGDIEQFMYWQAKEPEGFEFIIDGVQSYSYSKSGGKSRRDNPSDKYGHDYSVDDGGAGDRNLCPGMWMDPGSSGAEIFKNVTGQSNIEMFSSWCTGEQLLDIYTQELEINAQAVQKAYPTTAEYTMDDTRLFALMDVMYAGEGNFVIGTIDDALLAGRELTKEDFLSNCTSENPFFTQNEAGFTRRRLMDWYIYSEGKYGYQLYDDTDMNDVAKRYEFISETPFQDLMMDKEGAEIVDM